MKKMLRIFKLTSKLDSFFLFIVIFRAILNAVVPFVTLYFSNIIIDKMLLLKDFEEIFKYALILSLVNFGSGILNTILTIQINVKSLALSRKMEMKVAMKNMTMNYQISEEASTKDLAEKAYEGQNANGDISTYADLVFNKMLSAIVSVINGLVISISLFLAVDKTIIFANTDASSILFKIINNYFSFLFIVIPFILVIILNVIILKKINKKMYEIYSINIDANRKYGYYCNICYNLTYGKNIRLYEMQDFIEGEMNTCNKSIFKNYDDGLSYSIRKQIILDAINKFFLLIIYLYVGLKAYFGLISIGSIVLYVGSVSMIQNSTSLIFQIMTDVRFMNNYLDNWFEYLKLGEDKEKAPHMPQLSSMDIEVKDLCFKYPGDENNTIDHLNLSIKNGEKIAIVGLNGSGKTTFIKILCGLYKPTSGKILIDGVDISKYDKKDLYNLFSVVFQDAKLLPLSIEDNIAGEEIPNEEKVMEVLEKAGLKEKIQKLPKGIKEVLFLDNGNEAIDLSGGEMEKACIARALYKDSDIVVLDEPTAALDPLAEAEIYKKFNEITKDKTSIFITHRMSSCIFCDRIFVFNKGTVIEEGTHQVLLNNKGLYHDLWEAQASHYQKMVK